MPQRLFEFRRGESCLAFCDVTGNRNGGAAQLRTQTIGLGLWKRLTVSIHIQDQTHRLFPNDEIAVRLNDRAYSIACAHYALACLRQIVTHVTFTCGFPETDHWPLTPDHCPL